MNENCSRQADSEAGRGKPMPSRNETELEAHLRMTIPALQRIRETLKAVSNDSSFEFERVFSFGRALACIEQQHRDRSGMSDAILLASSEKIVPRENETDLDAHLALTVRGLLGIRAELRVRARITTEFQDRGWRV